MFPGASSLRFFVPIGCFVAVGFAGLCMPSVTFAQKRPKIEALPHLDPALTFHFDVAYDVTDEGVVVGSSSSAQNQNRAVRWPAKGSPLPLGPVNDPTASSAAQGVSAKGNVVAGYLYPSSSRVFQAMRWTPATGMRRLPTFGDPSVPSFGNAVSADGRYFVGETFQPASGESRAVRWTSAGKVTFLGALAPGRYSGANDISDDGSVIVGYSETRSGPTRGFIWTEEEGIQVLGELPGLDGGGSANAVSGDGETIVGTQYHNASSIGRSFVWTSQGGMRQLARLSASSIYSIALDVSADGRVIAGWDFLEGGSTAVACLWIDRKPIALRTLLAQRDVNLDGWNELREIRGISPDGRILAGTGRFRGDQRVFRVTLANSAPIAEAGRDVVIDTSAEAGARVRLDGTQSRDPEGPIVGFKWTARGIRFDDTTSPRPVAKFPVGTTIVTLRVSDDLAASDSDAVRVTVRLKGSQNRPEGSAANAAFADAAGWAETSIAEGAGARAIEGFAYASTADSIGAALGDLVASSGNESSTDAKLRYIQLRSLQAAYGRRAIDSLEDAAFEDEGDAAFFAAIASRGGVQFAFADLAGR